MATNEEPELSKKPLAEHVNTDSLRESARKAAALLAQIPDLHVWIVHCKEPSYRDNSWFIGFTNKCEDEPLLLNIRIRPSNLIIEFRFPQYLKPEILDTLKWTSASWAYASYNECGEAAVVEIVRNYLVGLLPDYRIGKVKAGGKSAAEKLIRRHLQQLFPDTKIAPNFRPAGLRSRKGRPLEFDLWLPDLKLAIEVQGPQHFREVYGDNTALVENDQHKRQWCAAEGVKLLWMNWEGATTGLFRLPEVEQRKHLSELLTAFLAGQHLFLRWDRVGSHAYV